MREGCVGVRVFEEVRMKMKKKHPLIFEAMEIFTL